MASSVACMRFASRAIEMWSVMSSSSLSCGLISPSFSLGSTGRSETASLRFLRCWIRMPCVCRGTYLSAPGVALLGEEGRSAPACNGMLDLVCRNRPRNKLEQSCAAQGGCSYNGCSPRQSRRGVRTWSWSPGQRTLSCVCAALAVSDDLSNLWRISCCTWFDYAWPRERFLLVFLDAPRTGGH